MLARSSIFGLLSGVGLAACMVGCFIEAAPPSTFRFQCSKTDECPDGESCSDGLCQRPCGPGLEACVNPTFCVNGFCSSVCPLAEDVCPGPQECVPLSADEDEESGICTILCDDETHPCGEGQLCFAGFCATTCATTAECGSGESCSEVVPGFSVCVPSGGGGGGFP